jgi:integrase
MGRPPLPLNTWGKIRTYYRHDGRWVAYDGTLPDGVKPTQWRAIANYRDADGETRPVERTGPSRTKATNTLLEALTKRAGHAVVTPTSSSRFRDAATLYLTRIQQHRAGTTYDRYRGTLTNHALPALGALRITECTPARIEAYFDTLAEPDPTTGKPRYTPNTRRGIRKVISGTLQVAVRQGILDANPAKSLDPIEGGPNRKAKAHTAAEVRGFLTAMDADKRSVRADLPDFIRFLFGTGTRYGEALAVRWRDLNLTDHPVKIDGVTVAPRSVWINGNLVHVTGKGVVRHDGKTFRANRTVDLPAFLITLLSVRRPVDADDLEPVFPSATLGWKSPSNVQRAIRRMNERIGTDIHTHDGRATVITMLDDAKLSARQIADVAGHSLVSTTQAYMGRGVANPQAAAIIDAAHRPSTR